MRLPIGNLVSWQELHAAEVLAEFKSSFELAHVLAVSSEAADLNGAVGFLVGCQPKSSRIPVRVVDLVRIVALELLQLVAVGSGSAAPRQHVRNLHTRGGPARSRRLALLECRF